jgi:hypothetical protein
MHSFVLQDFVTIRGSSTTLTISQSESEWAELGPFEDIVAWIDVREVTLSGAASIAINLQTAPLKDEFLFVTMESSPLTVTGALTTPSVRKMLLSQATGGSGAPVPLGKFFRWQLLATGATTTWDVMFRIVCCANAVGDAGRPMLPGFHLGGRSAMNR